MKNIAFISPHISYPPIGGPWRRSYINYRALTKFANVYLFLWGDLPSLNSIDANGIDHFTSLSKSITPLKGGGIEAFLEKIETMDVDIIWLCYAGLMFSWIPKIRKRYESMGIVADTDSVWSEFILREYKYVNRIDRKLGILVNGFKKRYEEKYYGKMADVVTAVSNIDKSYYDKLYKGNIPVKIIPNVLQLEEYFPDSNYDIKPVPGKKICFTATMSTSAHEDAVKWMSKQVMPLIWEKYPDIIFYIVGRDPTPGIRSCASDRVIVTGTVDSVLSYLYGSIAAVVPIRFESGTRSKIIEAFASKVPVVATSLGYEGFAIENRKHLLVADNEKVFADSITELIANTHLRDVLINNGLEFARANYCVDIANKEILQIVSSFD